MPQVTSVFIGSSKEGKPLAQQLQLNLDSDTCRTELWTQGIFPVGGQTLESLVAASHAFDFAVLLLTPDDLVATRGTVSPAARDNLIFEAGLFVGSLGRERTFLVYCPQDGIALPSDLDSVTKATYRQPAPNENLHALMGPPATQILNAIERANATGTSPNHLRAFMALVRQLSTEELVRLTTPSDLSPDSGSLGMQLPLELVEKELEDRGQGPHIDLSREDLLREIRKYHDIRVLMPGGPGRTALLEDILGEVRRKARRQKYQPELVSRLLDGTEGERIVGLALARARPDSRNFAAVVRVAKDRLSNFEQAQALQALIAMAEAEKIGDIREARQVADDLLGKRDDLIVEGDASRLILVEKLAAELDRPR